MYLFLFEIRNLGNLNRGQDELKVSENICFHIRALFTSQEAPEDDYQAGIADLLKVRGLTSVVLSS